MYVDVSFVYLYVPVNLHLISNLMHYLYSVSLHSFLMSCVTLYLNLIPATGNEIHHQPLNSVSSVSYLMRILSTSIQRLISL